MKHAISVPSVLTGRRVRWTFELTAERQVIPLSGPPAASAPQTPARAEPIVTRSGRSAFGLALAVAAVGVVAAIVLARHLAAGEEYEVADPSFQSQASTDRDSTVAPIANAPATTSAPAMATPAAALPVTPSVRPIATPAAVEPVTPMVRPIAARQAAADVERTPSGKSTRIAAASAPAPPPVAAASTHVVETHEPKQAAAAATAADVSAIAVSPPSASPTTEAPVDVDEVTITGCLEVARDDDRFRLSDTEGANAPQARSWRSGFFKKRSTSIDLIGSTAAFTAREVGQRVAVTGVLSSRKLKVSSMRVVSPSCN